MHLYHTASGLEVPAKKKQEPRNRHHPQLELGPLGSPPPHAHFQTQPAWKTTESQIPSSLWKETCPQERCPLPPGTFTVNKQMLLRLKDLPWWGYHSAFPTNVGSIHLAAKLIPWYWAPALRGRSINLFDEIPFKKSYISEEQLRLL